MSTSIASSTSLPGTPGRDSLPPVAGVDSTTPQIVAPAAEAPATATDAGMQAQIAQLIATITEAIARISAQLSGTGAVTTGGGGGIAEPDTGSAVDIEDLNAASFGGAIGGGDAWSAGFEVGLPGEATLPVPGVTGGGPTVATAPTDVIVGGGDAGPGFEVGLPGGALGAPAATGVTGGGAAVTPAATVDMRRVTGTPQAGGIVATIIARASDSTPVAMSEGTWRVLSDASGAQMQVHVHGAWATQSEAAIAAAISSGQIGVHLHPDGTVHLHDVM